MRPDVQQPDPRTDSPQDEVLRLSVHADAGPQSAAASGPLVEHALHDCDASPGTPVSVAVPAGDGAMVARLHDLLEGDEAHRAGATVMVEGVLPAEG